MALKLRGNQTEASIRKSEANRFKPIVLNNSTTTFSQPSTNLSPNQSNGINANYSESKPLGGNSMIGQSFEKMGIGKIGGLGGRMGQLEQASMRLAQAASDRRMGETEQEYKLKGGLLGQEYGLRGGLLNTESDIALNAASKAAGYSSPQQMQYDLQKKRREDERRKEDSRPYTIDRRGRRVYS
jgi:hypothetical protein